MLCLGVAKELGLTYTKLMHEVTEEELLLWSAYFQVLNEDQEAAMKKARAGRR